MLSNSFAMAFHPVGLSHIVRRMASHAIRAPLDPRQRPISKAHHRHSIIPAVSVRLVPSTPVVLFDTGHVLPWFRWGQCRRHTRWHHRDSRRHPNAVHPWRVGGCVASRRRRKMVGVVSQFSRGPCAHAHRQAVCWKMSRADKQLPLGLTKWQQRHKQHYPYIHNR